MKRTSTILIVDDQPLGRKMLAALLRDQGYDLAFADSGPEALTKAAQLTPDLILLDVMMPGMDGFEVCRRLRADPLLAEVPVIMVTALDNRDSRLQGIEAGADDFISKPIDPAELRARVRKTTQLNRYRRLLLERARFERVIEQADEGYIMIDGGDEILYANHQARLYLGLPLDKNEPISTRFLALAQKQYRCEPHKAWQNWPNPRLTGYLVRAESSTAHAFWLQVDILDLPASPDVGQVVRLRDVTAQMALQQDMRGFHALITHKMRTPLISISSGLELMLRHANKLSPQEIVKFAQSALNGVERLRGEIEDIIQYLQAPLIAQPGGGFDLLDLQALLADISADLRIRDVRVSGHHDLANSKLWLSPRAVELAFWEILENAAKFHPQQDPLVQVKVALGSADRISLQISDDGVTLSPEQLAQVWTPYYQGEKDFTGEVSGMGLGLAMVAALVWQVGGTCRAFNRPDGPGVVIELLLPWDNTPGD